MQVHAPTDDKDNDIRDEFYTVLQEVVDETPRGDSVVVMGDHNARVRAFTDKKVLEQGAFWRRSCIDQLFSMRQHREEVNENDRTMIMVCVDLEEAFDRVNRELWQVLERYVPEEN